MSLRQIAASGVRWSAVSHFGRRILSLGSNIILARLLLPEDFGLVAMASVVVGLLELFRDLGTGSAIVQKRDLTDELLSSIFWLNAAFGLVVTIGLYLGAGAIGSLYAEPRVAPLLQVMAVSFLVSALSIVQTALLTRAMEFERLARVEVLSALVAVIAACSAAFAGAGVWSLVLQALVSNVATLAGLWSASKWRPRWHYAWNDVQGVMGYSLNLTGFNILNFFARNADNLLIGRFLGAENLGYYDLAYKLMLYPLQGIAAVVGRVMFPLYAKMQDDNAQFRHVYLSIAGAISLVTFPAMLGLFVIREPVVFVVFGPKWEPVVALLALFAPLGAIQSIATTVGAIYQAKGRTDILLRWGVFSGAATIGAFAIGVQWGIVGVAVCYCGVSILLMYPGFAIPFRLIELPVSAVFRAVALPACCASGMALMVWLAEQGLPASIGYGERTVVLVVFGALSYMGLVWLLDWRHAVDVLQTLRGKR